MDKKLLMQLKARNEKRLGELRTKLEKNEVREDDIAAVEEEVTALVEEVQALADEIANLADDDTPPEGDAAERDGEGGDDGEGSDEGEDDKPNENRSGMLTPEQRDKINNDIAAGLSVRGRQTNDKKSKQIRKAFADFVIGNISEQQARSLGIDAGNGSVTVPVEIATEVITYAQNENLMRKYGSYIATDADVKYPVLVKKATANVNKKERTTEIVETGIEFDSIDLDPAEFDALATITKKLLKRTGVKIEDIVIEELKKAYVRKEANYMFNGNDSGNENPGALAKKAVNYFESKPVLVGTDGWSQVLQDELTIMTGEPVTEVVKNAMWIVNRAAYNVLNRMTDVNGRKLLTKNSEGLYEYDNFPLDFTDDANKSESDVKTPVFYFGNFKSFHIQEVDGGLELQKLVEKFSGTNKIGFQIYNLIDGQLIYSPFEPSVYRYEIGATAPTGGD